MLTMTVPWWLFWLLGAFVAAGFVAVMWLLAGWAERLGDWLRDRVAPLLKDDDELTDLPPGMELPPERTWEQMTSHQLPMVTLPRLGTPIDPRRAERERPPWESEHRAHYAAMGFDYPSGLMARVREAAP